MRKVFSVNVPFVVNTEFVVVADTEKDAIEYVQKLSVAKWQDAIKKAVKDGNWDVNESGVIVDNWGPTAEETTKIGEKCSHGHEYSDGGLTCLGD